MGKGCWCDNYVRLYECMTGDCSFINKALC